MTEDDHLYKLFLVTLQLHVFIFSCVCVLGCKISCQRESRGENGI